jgi:hypothetical protein
LAAYPIEDQILDPPRLRITGVGSGRELRKRGGQHSSSAKTSRTTTTIAFVLFATVDKLKQTALELVIINESPACSQLRDKGCDHADVGLLSRMLHNSVYVSRTKCAEETWA